MMAKKAREFNNPLYLVFVDFRKAYNLVNRDALHEIFEILERGCHVSSKILRILKTCTMAQWEW